MKYKMRYLVALLALVLSSCGGGGNSSTPDPVPQTSNDWDTIVWDEDNWG